MSYEKFNILFKFICKKGPKIYYVFSFFIKDSAEIAEYYENVQINRPITSSPVAHDNERTEIAVQTNKETTVPEQNVNYTTDRKIL